jgi:hypothetical protein
MYLVWNREKGRISAGGVRLALACGFQVEPLKKLLPGGNSFKY